MMLCIGTVANAASIIKWDAPTGTVKGYIIYYTDGTTEWSELSPTTMYPLANLLLDPGVEYTFTVTAYSDIGESARSNTAKYTPPAIFTPITNPKESIIIKIPGPVTIVVEQ